jgi:DDE superfamily endonuclease
LRLTNDSYRVDETYVKVKGEWKYLYRAVDSAGQTIDFMLRLSLAQKAWGAYRSPDPHSLERLLAEDTSAWPFLRGAMELHLARYPSVHNGLGRTENKLLSLIAGGATKFGSLCPKFFNAEPAYGLGDSQIWRDLKRVAEAAQPLIQLAGFDAQHGASRLHAVCSITETGQRVLEGQADFVELNGIDLWLGGVHLRADNLWRWDKQVLVRATV